MAFEERILWDDVEGEAVTTIYGLLMCYVLADYKITFKDHCKDRVRQRHNKAEDLIVVFNPVIGQVVSVYINASNDNHDTLREELYNKDLDVQKRLEQCIKNSR